MGNVLMFVAARWPAALLVVLLAACGGSGGDAGVAGTAQTARASVPADSAMERVEPMVRRAMPGGDASPVKPRRADRSPPAQRVMLGRASQTARGAKALKLSRMGVPEQVGFGRELALTATPTATARRLQWQATASGGRAAAISFTSGAATGVRLGLQVQRLPWDAVVRVYAQGADTMLELSGREIMASVNRNIDADGATAAARTYWLPTVDGEESTVEIELPPGAAADAVEIAVPRLSHLFTSATGEQTAEAAATAGRANACLVDINCTTGFGLESNATAKMSFVGTDGFSYVCSGTLLNDKQSSGTPYFLSANHCISLQTEASTLTTYWFYRSASCNSSAVSSSTKTLTGGASLLYASSASDTSFMQLNKTPPAGVQYAGWDPAAPSVSTAVTGVHHPSGDLQKINKGSLTEFSSCTDLSNSESFSCTTTTSSGGSYLGIQWSSGATQPGSSGSGLYKTVGSTNYLIGQLYGGSSSCFDTAGEDSYGRFDVAYNAALSKWLGATSARSAVFRFYNTKTSTHFFTIDPAERDAVIKNYPQYSYEGPVFYAYVAAADGLSPVYRFYDNNTGVHFYTISLAEKNAVQASLPQFSFEGPTWYAQTVATATDTPVYRFYNTGTAAHFYTVSQAEKDYIVKTLPTYIFEGIGYYAWNTPN